jgi:hypothetical protein
MLAAAHFLRKLVLADLVAASAFDSALLSSLPRACLGVQATPFFSFFQVVSLLRQSVISQLPLPWLHSWQSTCRLS